MTEATHDWMQRRTTDLFHPWDAFGGENTEAWEFIRSLDKKLSRYPWYVGLSPFGSTLKGYSTSASDVDLTILYDGGLVPEDVEVLETVHQVAEAVNRQNASSVACREIIPEDVSLGLLRLGQDEEPFVIDPDQADVSVRSLAHLLERIARVLAAMSWWTTQVGTEGHPGKVARWRQKYRSMLEGFSSDVRSKLRTSLLAMIAFDDEGNPEKIGKIFPGYASVPAEERAGVSRSRLKMWEDRINKLFGL